MEVSLQLNFLACDFERSVDMSLARRFNDGISSDLVGKSLCILCDLCASVVSCCRVNSPQRHREHKGGTRRLKLTTRMQKDFIR
jgi:hypothetical protein